jgi:hypothetical protein
MTWDYAKLSKAAKKFGGPEKLIDSMVKYGIKRGHKEMLPWCVLSLGAGVFAHAGMQKMVQYFAKEEETSAEKAKFAKKELIKGIEEYDALHSKEGNECEEEQLTIKEKLGNE